MKKFLAMVIMAAALLCAAATGASAKTLDPYSGIFTMEHDDSPEAIAEGNLPETYISQNGYVGDLWPGALVYRNVDFGDLTAKKATLYAGLPLNHAARVDLKVDKIDGPTLATFQMKGQGDWNDHTPFESEVFQEIKGVHDIWFVMTGGNARMWSFEFFPEEYNRNPIELYDGTGNFNDGLTEDDKFYAQIIGGLGFKSGDDNKIDTNLSVSRGTFVGFIDWVMNYIGDGERYFTDVTDEHEYYEAVTRLKDYDIIAGYGDMTFKPDQAITGSEAANICANALGYNKAYTNEYVSVKAKLLSSAGITNASEQISTMTAMKMLYKFLTSDYINYDMNAKNIAEAKKEKHILEKTRDIYLETGIVDGNVFCMIDDPSSSTGSDEVSVNGNLFGTAESTAERYLGRKCEYFVYKGDDEDKPQILSIAPERKSESRKITHGSEPYMDGETICYRENNSVKKIKLSQKTIVIYNSASYENVDISQILNMQNLEYKNGAWVSNGQKKRDFRGSVEAVTFDGGKTADVVFVKCYDNIVVSGYDASGKTLQNKLFDKSYYMSGDDETSYAVIYSNGEAFSYKDLQENMAGIIYQSINNDGKRVITAYFSNDGTDGRISAIGDDYVVIDSQEYDVSEDFRIAKNVRVGMEGKFILNPYNEIIWLITDAENVKSERLAAFINGWCNETGDDAKILVYDMHAGLKEYSVNEKIRLEGISTKNYEQVMKGTAVYPNIGISALKRGFLIKIKTNAEDKVTFIDSQMEGAGGEDDCVKMLSGALGGEQLVYRWAARIFGSQSSGNLYPIADDTVLINSPSPASEEYKAGEGFNIASIQTLEEQDQARDFVLYATDYQTNVASTVIYYTDKSSEYDRNNIYVFEGESVEYIDRKGEIGKAVSLNIGGLSKDYKVERQYAEKVDFSSFIPGTILKVATNSYGEIIGVQKMFVPNSDDGVVNDGNPENEPYINSALRLVWAEAEGRDNSFLKLKKGVGTLTKTEYVYTPEMPVYVCSKNGSRVRIEKTNASAVSTGDKILFVLDYGRVKQAIIYR